MAPCPITLADKWENSGNSGTCIFGGSRINVYGDYSQEIKRCLILEEKL